ncbi:DUF4038 domain-containing protein [Pseudonocardia sp. GCM10023141]|uniref:apiosidase-like domain-containing protein n=1 Tax=Pseudonocardia sp. GCM10023141 TaxID=3252653 RepID=UPI0036104377
MSPAAAAPYEVLEIRLGPAPADASGTGVDVVFTEPAGRERRVPAFVTGGEWRVRYASDQLGTHSYRACPAGVDAADGPELPDPGEVEIAGAGGPGALGQHGPLQVAADQRHLEHADGTPFLWLADTWWNGLVDRLSDKEFRELAAMRAQQGFSVVQIVAGLYPEMAPFAPEGRSASGWAWHEDFTAPNPDWFDEADRRVLTLLEHDLVPCIFGSWAYYLQFMDVEQTSRHWRELVARWGAYPVVWCLAGEPPLVLPAELLAGTTDATLTAADAVRMIQDEAAIADQLARLNEVARAVRRAEPFGRPITIHSYPATCPWDYLDDESVVDFWLLQTGHSGQNSLEPSVNAVHEAVEHRPAKPVINGEVCYEGICGSSWHETQRFLFWSHLLSGAAGHTYGAQGLWGFNTAEYPNGLRGRWGELDWPEAAELPGAAHLGTGRRLLLDLPWHEFTAHPEWIEPHQDADDRLRPYAAGIPDGVRVIYFPVAAFMKQRLGSLRLPDLGRGAWQANYVNPRTGQAGDPFVVEPDSDGVATVRGATPLAHFALPSAEDWLLVLRPAR